MKMLLLATTLLAAMPGFAQQTNKTAILSFYEDILNKRHLEKLDNLISSDYTNDKGEKGVEAFRKQLKLLISAFPDMQWKVTAIVAEGDEVFARQTVEGTHTGTFQQYSPTNRHITNQGSAFFRFKNGQIIYSQTQTDRLSFLQQLGIISEKY